MVYPALLPLMRTPRLPVVDWTDAPADLNGLLRFAERGNMVSARVPSHFKRILPKIHLNLHATSHAAVPKINCKFFALPTRSEVRHNAALETQNSAQMLSSFPLLHAPSSPLPHHLTFLTSQVLSCHQSGLTTRTSGQCLATLEQRNFLTALHPFEH